MPRFIVSLVLLLATLGVSVAIEGGNMLAYIAPTALAIVLFVPLFAMLAVWRFAEIGNAFRDAFSKKTDSASRVRSIRIWDFTEKVSYAAGLIGLIVGVVIALSVLRSSVAELGRALAVCLLTPLYGLMLGLVCRILKARVEQ